MEYILAFVGVTVTTAGSLVVIWFLDRFEKEPVWLLALVFIWGAVPAVILSLIAEGMFGIPLGFLVEEGVANVVMGSLVAPVVEESAKALALLAVFFLLRNQLDDVMDGIVFGAVVGAGFAWIEDVLYVCSAFKTGGLEGMGTVFFIRVFVFGLNHAFFTALAGLGFGLARLSRSCWVGGLAVLGFFGLAMGAHFLHNTLVGVFQEEGLIISFVTHWMGVIGLACVIVIAWIIEFKWIREELREECPRGTIGERDYKQVTKWFGRLGWELRFLAAFDVVGFFRVRKMFNLLVKLAFVKRAYRRRPTAANQRSVEELRAKVAKCRAAFAS